MKNKAFFCANLKIFAQACVISLCLSQGLQAQVDTDFQNQSEVNPFRADNDDTKLGIADVSQDDSTLSQKPTSYVQPARKTVISVPNQMNAKLATETTVPYGYNLFNKINPNSDKTAISPSYKIVSGDRVKLNIWGAIANESILTVDTQGNIFVPEVGPIHVSGLYARDLNSFIQSKIRKVYQESVEVYVNLQERTPVSVFVSGEVLSPGRHAGNPGDSILDYIVRAGGINHSTGSFRIIEIRRRNTLVEVYDLYDFMKSGKLPQTVLQEGDSLVVKPKIISVYAYGTAKENYSYELNHNHFGEDLLDFAQISPETTHVRVSGTRDDKPFNRYMSLQEFRVFDLYDGDALFFEQGTHSDNFGIKISGEHKGLKSMTIPKNARLYEVLQNIPVDPLLSRIDAIYLKRRSVAAGQKKSIQDSIKRLQETLLLSRASGNSTEAAVSEGELKLLEQFMAKTESIQPDGRVVVVGRKNILDIALEPEDEIVIPVRTDLIAINGEVILPQAIAWNEDDNVIDYIERSGGFTDNANKSKILVIRANGETELGKNIKVLPGDEIIVMPEVKINNLLIASSVADILYKAVLAVAIPMNLD